MTNTINAKENIYLNDLNIFDDNKVDYIFDPKYGKNIHKIIDQIPNFKNCFSINENNSTCPYFTIKKMQNLSVVYFGNNQKKFRILFTKKNIDNFFLKELFLKIFFSDTAEKFEIVLSSKVLENFYNLNKNNFKILSSYNQFHKIEYKSQINNRTYNMVIDMLNES